MKKKQPRFCHVCGKSSPSCDRAVYLAHGNGGAYGTAPAHKKCVKAAGPIAQAWNEELGWYVHGRIPGLRNLDTYT